MQNNRDGGAEAMSQPPVAGRLVQGGATKARIFAADLLQVQLRLSQEIRVLVATCSLLFGASHAARCASRWRPHDGRTRSPCRSRRSSRRGSALGRHIAGGRGIGAEGMYCGERDNSDGHERRDRDVPSFRHPARIEGQDE
jgi:hypothetical protein